MNLETCSQNAEIKPSKVQTHNFGASFSKPAKLEMEQSSSKAKTYQGESMVLIHSVVVMIDRC